MSVFLLALLDSQTIWKSSGKWSSQPALWPSIALIGMTVFGLLNAISAYVSPKIPGRWEELKVWLNSMEYVAWYMAYVFIVPILGYLPSTIIFSMLLAMRVGYRTPGMLGVAALMGTTVVLIFKTFLKVNVPGGYLYEYLPDTVRAIMLTYF